MTVHREMQERVQTVLAPTRVECDRCGRELRGVLGVMGKSGFDADVTVNGLQYIGRLYESPGDLRSAVEVDGDLCPDCTRDFREWLAAGRPDG